MHPASFADECPSRPEPSRGAEPLSSSLQHSQGGSTPTWKTRWNMFSCPLPLCTSSSIPSTMGAGQQISKHSSIPHMQAIKGLWTVHTDYYRSYTTDTISITILAYSYLSSVVTSRSKHFTKDMPMVLPRQLQIQYWPDHSLLLGCTSRDWLLDREEGWNSFEVQEPCLERTWKWGGGRVGT